MKIKELLSLETMIIPKVMTLFYWVSLAGAAVFTLLFLISTTTALAQGINGFLAFLLACVLSAVFLAVTLLIIRVYFELIILLFRIHDNVKIIAQKP